MFENHPNKKPRQIVRALEDTEESICELNCRLNLEFKSEPQLELKENLKIDSNDNGGKDSLRWGTQEYCDSVAVLTGLHACGDLSGASLKWFVLNSDIVGLCIVSCCYHKMNHFPMSETYERHIFEPNDTIKNYACLRSSFSLRLASQEPFSR